MFDSFLEAHYYSGGIRYRHFPPDTIRPVWALPPEKVGFRDEFTLRGDSAAVEVARFSQQGRTITYIGVYLPSVDEQLGDRRNYAGIGLWSQDCAVVSGVALLKALRALAEMAKENPIGAELEHNVQKFAAEGFLANYLRSQAEYPKGLSGISGKSGIAVTQLRYTPDVTEAGWAAVGADLMSATLGNTPERNFNRLVYLVGEPDRSDQRKMQVVNEPVNEFVAFVKSIPAAVEGATTENQELLKKLDSQSQRLAELEALRAASEAELEAARSESDFLKDRLAHMESNEDPVQTVRRLLTEFSGTLERMGQDRQQLRQSLEAARAETTQRHRTRSNASEAAQPYDDSLLIYMVGVTLLIQIVTLGVGIWLIAR